MKFIDAIKKSVNKFDSKQFIERIHTEDPSMIKYMKILQAINKLGYLTTGSQAGKHSKGYNPDTNKNYEISERAFIEGFMLESVAQKFISVMSVKTDKIALYIPKCSDDTYLPTSLDIPLTTQGKNPVKIVTHQSIALPSHVWNMYRKESLIDSNEKIVYIFVYDPVWNNGPKLFSQTLKVLKFINS